MSQAGLLRVAERRALGLASALHVAAILGVWAWGQTHTPATHCPAPLPTAADTAEREFEIDALDTSLAQPSTDHAKRERAASSKTMPPHGAPLRSSLFEARPSSLSALRDANEPSTEHSPNAELTATSEAASTQNQPEHPIDLNLHSEGWQRWLGSTKSDGPNPDSSANARRKRALFRTAPKSTTGGLQEGLEEQDRARGLGPSGPVVTALYKAAHASLAPETGVARFQVTVLESGAVEVTVSGASANLDGWRAVAAEASQTLRRSRPRIPEPRSGMRLAIELTAEEILPDGVRTKQLHGPRAEVEAPRLRSTAEAQAELKDRNPVAGENGQLASGAKANVNLPGVYLAERGKVCGYRVGLSALGPVLEGGCDLANLAAHTQRRVRARVLEETLF